MLSLQALCLAAGISIVLPGASAPPTQQPPGAFDGWSPISPRAEIAPRFRYLPKGGRSRAGSLAVEHDTREGLQGWFQRTYPVQGGRHYRFTAHRKVWRVVYPARSAPARVVWLDTQNRQVAADVDDTLKSTLGHTPGAEPEHPPDGATDSRGWTEVSGTYRAPSGAAKAVVELHLQWAPNGRVEWCDVQFVPTSPPQARLVRLAAVHYRPAGKSPRQNCEEMAPFIAEAAKQRADLVVLGETVPSVHVKRPPHQIAETIPGPTTRYFGELAKRHNLYIVLSLNERDRHLVYNTAVMLGPDGGLAGKYRKVCLPHSEVESGIAPGSSFPVFSTRFGKVGMMVCYDGFFPEVARELSIRGAEVIAWPVWGCSPLLAQARAAENRVFIVSSTYMEPKDNWMISAVFSPYGTPLVTAERWGSVAVAEVDLARPAIGPWNLGDFRSMLLRHRPPAMPAHR